MYRVAGLTLQVWFDIRTVLTRYRYPRTRDSWMPPSLVATRLSINSKIGVTKVSPHL